jgi:hypothetical protein
MLVSLIALLSAPLPAQSAGCPALSVSSSASEKGKASYSADLSGGDSAVSPTFNWSVSSGGIESGQGTPSITVEAGPGENVTATLEVGGYDGACSVMASDTVQIKGDEPCPELQMGGQSDAAGSAKFGAMLMPMVETTWKWSLSSGKIVKTVNTEGATDIVVSAPSGTTVIATVKAGGGRGGCASSGSATVMVK